MEIVAAFFSRYHREEIFFPYLWRQRPLIVAPFKMFSRRRPTAAGVDTESLAFLLWWAPSEEHNIKRRRCRRHNAKATMVVLSFHMTRRRWDACWRKWLHTHFSVAVSKAHHPAVKVEIPTALTKKNLPFEMKKSHFFILASACFHLYIVVGCEKNLRKAKKILLMRWHLASFPSGVQIISHYGDKINDTKRRIVITRINHSPRGLTLYWWWW